MIDAGPPIWLPPKPAIIRPAADDVKRFGIPGLPVMMAAAAAAAITDEAADAGANTPVLRARFNASPLVFDNNSISGAFNGSLTYNAAGGALAGYASGWSGANNISFNSLTINGHTFFAWYKGTQDGNNTSSNFVPYVAIFGDDSSSHDGACGINNGHAAYFGASNEKYEGSTDVADDEWHLMCWAMNGSTIDIWVDGTKEVNGSGTASAGVISLCGSARSVESGWSHPAALDGVQIYTAKLSDSDIQAVFSAAGF